MRTQHIVQSCITAVGFPNTLGELEDMILDNQELGSGIETDIDTLLNFCPSHHTFWTAPRWITSGDILFFYHTRTGGEKALRLARQAAKASPSYDFLTSTLERACDQARKYARTIFACAIVSGVAERLPDDSNTQHFKGKIFAPLADVYTFKKPLSLDELSRVITLSTGGTSTPVHGQSFTDLKELLAKNNELPIFLKDAVPGSIGFHSVNRSNWMKISTRPEQVFLDESQLRSYLLDFLLEEVKDPRTSVLSECECYREDTITGIADYFLRVEDHWIPVEAKLNIHTERDLASQLSRYVNIEIIKPRRGKFRGKTIISNSGDIILVADSMGVYFCESPSSIRELRKPTWSRSKFSRATIEAIRSRVRQLIT